MRRRDQGGEGNAMTFTTQSLRRRRDRFVRGLSASSILVFCACTSARVGLDAAPPDAPADAVVATDTRSSDVVAFDADRADALHGDAPTDTPRDQFVADAGGVDPACLPPASCGPCSAGDRCGGGGVLHRCGARACTHYVAPMATAATTYASCTTERTPCTLATANAGARAGDVICLAGGEYRTAIAPAASGVRGRPITFVSASDATPATIRGVREAVALTNVSFIEVDGIRVEGGTNTPNQVVRFFALTNADDCWLRNMTFHDALAYVGSTVDVNSSRNRITNCLFPDAASPGVVAGMSLETWPADTVEIRGDGTLLEANDFGDVSHYPITVWVSGGHRTIVRANAVHNRLHAGMNLLALDAATGRVLVEGNRILDTGANYLLNPNSYSRTHGVIADDYAVRGRQVSVQLGAYGVLFRRNDVAHGGRGMSIAGWQLPEGNIHPSHVRLAHNSFYANLTGFTFENDNPTVPFVDIVVSNNIVHTPAGITELLRDAWGDSAPPTAQRITNNAWTPSGTFVYLRQDSRADRSLAAVQAAYAPNWSGNVAIDPAFADAAARDFRIGAGSPALDAAAPLTTITSASSSAAGATSFVVADAWWFFDGWNLADETGDMVMTASGHIARVVAADEASGTVTVDRPLVWTRGEGIGLTYAGARGDLGAHERCE